MSKRLGSYTLSFLLLSRYVNDVGQAKWEEISEGGSDFIGADYGWPAREGPCPNSQTSNCADVHPYKDPIHFYRHDGGGACTGKSFNGPLVSLTLYLE